MIGYCLPLFLYFYCVASSSRTGGSDVRCRLMSVIDDCRSRREPISNFSKTWFCSLNWLPLRCVQLPSSVAKVPEVTLAIDFCCLQSEAVSSSEESGLFAILSCRSRFLGDSLQVVGSKSQQSPATFESLACPTALGCRYFLITILTIVCCAHKKLLKALLPQTKSSADSRRQKPSTSGAHYSPDDY